MKAVQTKKEVRFEDPHQGMCPRHWTPLILSRCNCRLIFHGGRILALTPQQYKEYIKTKTVTTKGHNDLKSKVKNV